MPKRGTIVLIPFPFTDLSSQKVRPVVIIAVQPKGEDVIALMISSIAEKKLHESDVEINLTHKEFAATGLKGNSRIKTFKIATLDKKILLGELGILPQDLLKTVDEKLKKVLGLK